MRFDVFGKIIEVGRLKNTWCAYYLGNEGKKRLAEDIVFPSDIKENEIAVYLSDLFHESAKPSNMEVKQID